MKLIAEDKWGKEVWGSGVPGDPTLYMYFGRNDPFVPDYARDALIASHGSVSGPEGSQECRAFIDTHEIPHSWCIKHGELIAEKIAPWIENIILRNSGST